MDSRASKRVVDRTDERLAVRTGPSVFDRLRQGILAGKFAHEDELEAFAQLSKDREELAKLIACDSNGELREGKADP